MSELPCITDSGDERGGTECANAGDADEALTELAAARNQVDLMGERETGSHDGLAGGDGRGETPGFPFSETTPSTALFKNSETANSESGHKNCFVCNFG
jgi:hypothetical protein